jgi:hypothetical protein
MDDELPQSSDKTLNRLVALTVVILSVFMGLAHIKDDNLVQAMQLSKSDAVDTWSEYQAARTKLHVAQTAQAEMVLIAGPTPTVAARQAIAAMSAEIAKYTAEAPRLRGEAEADEGRYNSLNVHDDQFDLSDALISIAVSLAAVAALADSRPLLGASWLAGALGLLFGFAGFAGWSLHPDALAALLS